MEEEINLEELEDVEFKIDKDAFEPKELICSNCRVKMKKSEIVISLDNRISVTLSGFECVKCKKKYLGLEEAKKMDKALIVNRIMKDDFRMERSLSYDGSNWTFRVPKEFTQKVSERKVEIIPLGAKQFCVEIR